MVAPNGSGVQDVMEGVSDALRNRGKRTAVIRSIKEIVASNFSRVDYVVMMMPIVGWREVEEIGKRFDLRKLKLFSHVPLWRGETKKGYAELVDVNWSAWCATNIVMRTANEWSERDVRNAHNANLDILHTIPKILREYRVISIANTKIPSLTSSVRVAQASLDELKKTHFTIDSMNPSVEQMRQMIICSI